MNSSSSSDVPLLMISLLFIMLGLAVSQTNNGEAARSWLFTFVNNCSYTVWPGVLTTGTTQTDSSAFNLEPGDSRSVSIPRTWKGQVWGRTLCTLDSSSSNFSCLTGDCGSSRLACYADSAIRSATLAEFTLGPTLGQDFYHVSLVMGYNLPIMISPHGGTGGDCTPVGCTKDLNDACPRELKVSDAVACDSPCHIFGDPQYCCTGDYASSSMCKPTNYSRFFKNLCPAAYSYAYHHRFIHLFRR